MQSGHMQRPEGEAGEGEAVAAEVAALASQATAKCTGFYSARQGATRGA